ncbi:hypothetical protein [Novipirellula sp.]|uniref:hypothetical protein n=1 Tax=Novipirellula sp. TaxID=2795430 RepID=UPI003561B614
MIVIEFISEEGEWHCIDGNLYRWKPVLMETQYQLKPRGTVRMQTQTGCRDTGLYVSVDMPLDLGREPRTRITARRRLPSQ